MKFSISIFLSFLLLASFVSAAPRQINPQNSFCQSNPSFSICQQRITIPCQSQLDCPGGGSIFCNGRSQPSRFDCLRNTNTNKRECVRSYVHSSCTLWMPLYDRYIFFCDANNQLNWTLEQGFCHMGQFCTISSHQNVEKAICWNFAGSSGP